MRWSRRRMIGAGLVGVLIAAVVTVIALNFVTGEQQVDQKLEHRYAIDDAQFRRELGTLLGPSIIDGNQITNLENGLEIFPAILQAVRAARHNVSFETYVHWSGDVGREFAEALSEHVRAGVQVHVLIDWLGSQKMEQAFLDMMTEAGAQVERYHPLRRYHVAPMNNRTHRKLPIVDGEVGFTGDVGIADNWSGDTTSPDPWRDSHYRLQGPASGDSRAQVFISSPSGGGDSMQLMYLLSITAAVQTIDLPAAYFVPDDLTRRAIRAAPTEVVRKASRAKWGELLAAGAEIHEFQPTMFHCKMLIVDQLMVSVGSISFDNRSFRRNDEANLNIYDAEFAARAGAVFEQHHKRALRMTCEAWKSRPWQERLLEHAAALLSSQL